MLKAVFWDLGGTLCRTDAGGKLLGGLRLARALKPFCGSLFTGLHKIYLVMRAYKEVRETPGEREPELKDLIPRVFPDQPFDPLLVAKTVYEEALKYTNPLPGAVEAVAAVAATGLPMALVTDGFYGRDYVERALEKLGIKDRFRTVVISCEVGAGKPQPALFLAACREMGVKPEETLFIGDTEDRDIAGAAGVGMRTLLLWKAPRRTRPDFFFPDLHQLAKELPALLAAGLGNPE
ncbi:MAG: HAD family hydrolase [Firmicutes bacterium]|nr:HAD family hydrolase [Bacillota bacterium]